MEKPAWVHHTTPNHMIERLLRVLFSSAEQLSLESGWGGNCRWKGLSSAQGSERSWESETPTREMRIEGLLSY